MSMEEIVGLIDAGEGPAKKRRLYKKREENKTRGEVTAMTPKQAVTMCLHGTVGGLLVGWAIGSRDWMYSLANPRLLGTAELAVLFVGGLLLIRTNMWLIKNLGAFKNSD
jgi:hypothetical protein